MKGPQERLKYDLRRLWECPACKRREKAAASATFRFCSCQMKQADGKPVVMKLIQDGVQRLTPKIVIEHERPAVVEAAVPTIDVTEVQPEGRAIGDIIPEGENPPA